MSYGEVKPVGNDYLLTYGNEFFYERRYEHAREFAFTFGMVSDKGATEPTNLQDGVLAYFGVEARAGSGDVWSLNPMLTLCAGFARNAQQCESDLNNNSQHFGNADGSAGLAAPSVYHWTYNGYSQYDITGVLLFNQSGPGKVNRNITFANGCKQSGIENYDAMTALIENNGAPDYVIRSRGPISKAWLGGEVGLGASPVSGIPLYVFKAGPAVTALASNEQVVLRLSDCGAAANFKHFDFDWNGGVFNWICRNDDGSVRAVPLGFDTMNMIIRPVPDNAVELGYDGLRWKRVSTHRLSLKPPASDTPTTTGEMTFEAVSNTQLRLSLKGSDGVVRSTTLALS